MIKKDNILKKSINKKYVALVSLVVIILVVTIGTLAFLYASSNNVVNTFNVATVDIELEEKFNNNIKTDVYVSNPKTDTSADCYVRVMLICNWYTDITVNNQPVQQLVGKNAWDISTPENDLKMNTTDWFNGSDGYYYYKYALNPGERSENLINSIKLLVDENDGTYQGLEILAEEVQAKGMLEDGTYAVEDTWSAVEVDDDTLMLKQK